MVGLQLKSRCETAQAVWRPEYVAYSWGLHGVAQQDILLLRSVLQPLRGVLSVSKSFPLLFVPHSTHMHTHRKRESLGMIDEAAVPRIAVILTMNAMLLLYLEGTLILESTNIG